MEMESFNHACRSDWLGAPFGPDAPFLIVMTPGRWLVPVELNGPQVWGRRPYRTDHPVASSVPNAWPAGLFRGQVPRRQHAGRQIFCRPRSCLWPAEGADLDSQRYAPGVCAGCRWPCALHGHQLLPAGQDFDRPRGSSVLTSLSQSVGEWLEQD